LQVFIEETALGRSPQQNCPLALKTLNDVEVPKTMNFCQLAEIIIT
jgi:hypothetical protein